MQEEDSISVCKSGISLYLDLPLPQKWLPEHETADFLGSARYNEYYRDWKMHSILKKKKKKKRITRAHSSNTVFILM